MTFTWIEPKRGGNNVGGNKGTGVSFNIYKSGKNKPQLSIRIYKDVMKKMRWVAGDRVQVGFDDTKEAVAIRRVPVGGYSASPTVTGIVERKKLIGTTTNVVVKMTCPDGIIDCAHSPVFITSDQAIDQDGILIFSIKAEDKNA